MVNIKNKKQIGNIFMTWSQSMCTFVGQNVKNSESDFLATVENFKENLKFPLAFGGECTADFWVNFSVEKCVRKAVKN